MSQGSPKNKLHHQIHPGRPGHFDAVIVWKWKENQKTNIGGVAYEMILKPAAGDLPRPTSPPKEKGLTHIDIIRKLQEAEERRQSLEAEKLANISKSKERVQEALAKAQQENESFSRATEEKLRRSMEVNKENREAQIEALQSRLREHLRRRVGRVTQELDEKIKSKMEQNKENRNAQTEAMLQRLYKHEIHIENVIKANEEMGKHKYSQEKVLEKVQKAIENREKYLQKRRRRLQEHEKKIEEVRKNKSVLKTEGECSPVQ